MNFYNLEKALAVYLENSLGNLLLLRKKRPIKGEKQEDLASNINIYVGDLPPKANDEDEQVPFVCIIFQSGQHLGDEGLDCAEIILRLAVFSRDPQDAEEELALLISAVRSSLFKFTQHALDDYFRLVTDEKDRLLFYEKSSEQITPYNEAYILSRWNFKGYEQEINQNY